MEHLITGTERSLGVTFPTENEGKVVVWSPTASHIVSPYIPLLFMGEEWGETSPFFYFVSHSKPDLIDAVREGRKQEFAVFHSDEEVPDPVSDETYEQAKLQWNLLDEKPHQMVLHRWHGEQHVLCLMNFSKQLQSIQIPTAGAEQASWQKLLDSTDTQWQPQTDSEPTTAPEKIAASDTITVQPESILIYSQPDEQANFYLPGPISPRFYLS